MLRTLAGLLCLALVLAVAVSARAGKGEVALRVKEGFGSYLVDGKGMALYFSTRDKPGEPSACAGECQQRWPPFRAEYAEPGPGLDARDFDVVDGQVAFRGYPLFYFLRDAIPGDTTGDGFGNAWFLVFPATFPAEP